MVQRATIEACTRRVNLLLQRYEGPIEEDPVRWTT